MTSVDRSLCEPGAVLEPDGLQFSAAVTLEMDVPSRCRTPLDEPRLAQFLAGHWSPLETATFPGGLRTQLRHFSTYGVVINSIRVARGTGWQLENNQVTVSLDDHAPAEMMLLATETVVWVGAVRDTGIGGGVTLQGLAPGPWFWSVNGHVLSGVSEPVLGALHVPFTGVATADVVLTRQHGTRNVTDASQCNSLPGALLPGSLTEGVCTLSADIHDSLELAMSTAFTLDCAGHTIRAPSAGGVGVLWFGQRIGIRNCTVENFDIGVKPSGRWGRVESSTFRRTVGTGDYAILVSYDPLYTVTDNHVDGSYAAGIGLSLIASAGHGVLRGNHVANVGTGLALFDADSQSTISWNDVQANSVGIAVISGQWMQGPMLENNDVTSSGAGLYVELPVMMPTVPRIRHNSIVGTPGVVSVDKGDKTTPAPLEVSVYNEGNFWHHTSPPHFVAGVDSNDVVVVDGHPYCVKDGWALGFQPGECAAGPPAAPEITEPADGSLSNAAVAEVRGLVGEVGTLRVWDGADEVTLSHAEVTTDQLAPNHFSVRPVNALGHGTHLLTASLVRGSDGVESVRSPVVTVHVDTQSPDAPVLVSPLNGTVVGSLVVRGTAERGAIVYLRLDGGEPQLLATDLDGSFGPLLVVATDGEHVLEARSQDAAGNLGDPAEVSFRLDATPPGLPQLASPIQDRAYLDPVIEISGTAEDGSLVKVTLDDVLFAEMRATGGQFGPLITGPLSHAQHTVSAYATDDAGNAGLPRVIAFWVTGEPAPPTITLPPAACTRTVVLSVSGTMAATEEGTIRLFDNGVPVQESAVSGTAFAFLLSTPLVQGEHVLEAQLAWFAGQVVSGRSPAVRVVVDSVSPLAPLLDAPRPDVPLAVSMVPVEGRAEPLSWVFVWLDSETRPEFPTTVADNLGLFAAMVGPLTSDWHVLHADAVDCALNASPVTDVVFEVDLVPPTTPSITEPHDGAVFSATYIDVQGRGEIGSRVDLVLSGGWEASRWLDTTEFGPIRFAGLPIDDYTLTVIAIDRAGNSSGTEVTHFRRVQAPGAPVLTAPLGAWSNTTEVTVQGVVQAATGAWIRILDHGVLVDERQGVDGVTFAIPVSLAEGAHSLQAQVLWYAGQVASPLSEPAVLTVDLTPPAAAVITSPLPGTTEATGSVEIAGYAEPYARVQLELRGLRTGVVRTATLGSASGTFGPMSFSDLPPDDYTLTATAIDLAGNYGVKSEVHFQRVAAPSAPVLSAQPAWINSASVVLEGVLQSAADAWIRVFDEGVLIAEERGIAGPSFSVTLTLGEGAHSLQAQVLWYDGQVSSLLSDAATFTVDVTPPPPPNITFPTAGATIADGNLSVSGTAEPFARVRLTVTGVRTGEVRQGLGTALGDGTFLPVLFAALPPDEYTLTAWVEDRAGNMSPPVERPFGVPADLPPVAVLSASPSAVLVGEPVVLDASASTDAEDPTGNLRFLFQRGTLPELPPFLSAVPSVRTSYPAPGTYTAQVTVYDHLDHTARAEAEVCVTASSSLPTVAAVGESVFSLGDPVGACDDQTPLCVKGVFPEGTSLFIDGHAVVAAWSQPRSPVYPYPPRDYQLLTVDHVGWPLTPGTHQVQVSAPNACGLPVTGQFTVSSTQLPSTDSITPTEVVDAEPVPLVIRGVSFGADVEVRFFDDVTGVFARKWTLHGPACGIELTLNLEATDFGPTALGSAIYRVEVCNQATPVGQSAGRCRSALPLGSLPWVSVMSVRDTRVEDVSVRGRPTALVGEARGNPDLTGKPGGPPYLVIRGGPFLLDTENTLVSVNAGSGPSLPRFYERKSYQEAWVPLDADNGDLVAAADVRVVVSNSRVGGSRAERTLRARCLGTDPVDPTGDPCSTAAITDPPDPDPEALLVARFPAFSASQERGTIPTEGTDHGPWIVMEQKPDASTDLWIRFFTAHDNDDCAATVVDMLGDALHSASETPAEVIHIGIDEDANDKYYRHDVHFTLPLPGEFYRYAVACRHNGNTGAQDNPRYWLQRATRVRTPPRDSAESRFAQINDLYQEEGWYVRQWCHYPLPPPQPPWEEEKDRDDDDPLHSRPFALGQLRHTMGKVWDLLRRGQVEYVVVPGDVSNDTGWYADYSEVVVPNLASVCSAVPCYAVFGNHDYASFNNIYAVKNGRCMGPDMALCANRFTSRARLCTVLHDLTDFLDAPSLDPSDFDFNNLDFSDLEPPLEYGPAGGTMPQIIPMLKHDLSFDRSLSNNSLDRRPSKMVESSEDKWSELKQHTYYAFRWGGVGFAMMDLTGGAAGLDANQCEPQNGSWGASSISRYEWGFGHHGDGDAQTLFLDSIDESLPRSVRFLVSHAVVSGLESFRKLAPAKKRAANSDQLCASRLEWTGAYDQFECAGTPCSCADYDHDEVKRLALHADRLGYDMALAGHAQEGLGYHYLTAVGEHAGIVNNICTGVTDLRGNIWPFSSPRFAGVWGLGQHRGGVIGFGTYVTSPGKVNAVHWINRTEATAGMAEGPDGFYADLGRGFSCSYCARYNRGADWDGITRERTFDFATGINGRSCQDDVDMTDGTPILADRFRDQCSNRGVKPENEFVEPGGVPSTMTCESRRSGCE
jgi:hypothetical protein